MTLDTVSNGEIKDRNEEDDEESNHIILWTMVSHEDEEAIDNGDPTFRRRSTRCKTIRRGQFFVTNSSHGQNIAWTKCCNIL